MGKAHLGFAYAGIARRLEKSTSYKLVRRLKSLWLLDKCWGKTGVPVFLYVNFSCVSNNAVHEIEIHPIRTSVFPVEITPRKTY